MSFYQSAAAIFVVNVGLAIAASRLYDSWKARRG